MSDLMFTDDAGQDHQIHDVLMHCLNPAGEGLVTLCGQPYENVMYGNWPSQFKDFEGVETCPECVNHPDLPLARLGDL